MTDSVVTRRLKSLEQYKQEKQRRSHEARARKAEREAQTAKAKALGIPLYVLNSAHRGTIVVPLAGYYRRDDAFEARRARFYALIAKHFGGSGWRAPAPATMPFAGPGYGGVKPDIRQIGQTSAVNLNTASAPLEWLVARHKMETNKDATGQGLLRYAVARHFRNVMSDAEYAGLKGQAYDGNGGGSGGGRPITDIMIDAVKTLGRIRTSMHPGLFRLLIWVVCEDVWAWDRMRTAKQKRSVILKLHKAIDAAAIELGYVTKDDFTKRWHPRKWAAQQRKAGPGPASVKRDRRARP